MRAMQFATCSSISAPVHCIVLATNKSSPANAMWFNKSVCIAMCMCESACSSHTHHLCKRLFNRSIILGCPDYGSTSSIWVYPPLIRTAVFMLGWLYSHGDCSGCP